MICKTSFVQHAFWNWSIADKVEEKAVLKQKKKDIDATEEWLPQATNGECKSLQILRSSFFFSRLVFMA